MEYKELLILIKLINVRKFLSCFLLFLYGCSELEHSEYKKTRLQNEKAEYIYRRHEDYFFAIEPPKKNKREPYPWEVDENLLKITKEHFRCKGTSLHPPKIGADLKEIADCKGSLEHGFPLINNEEGVYPILIDLVNYLQKTCGKRVVITSGYRCPVHNRYTDPSNENRSSKYMIGAQVDFYVEGEEENPLPIIETLFSYFQEPPYKGKEEYEVFDRYERPDTDVSIKPWFNKEIFIKLYQKDEGRNFDNMHSHPYISIQVRYDKKTDQKVLYTWERAHRGYKKIY